MSFSKQLCQLDVLNVLRFNKNEGQKQSQICGIRQKIITDNKLLFLCNKNIRFGNNERSAVPF